MPPTQFKTDGLTDEQVLVAREKFGLNQLASQKTNEFVAALKRMATDPMLILLFTACAIYFVSGKIGDAIFLALAIVFQTSISLYQYARSNDALEKLKDLSKPTSKVIRNGEEVAIKNEEMVVGDSMVVEEGGSVAADGVIVQSNDFSVNESILTGESFAVFKAAYKAENQENQIYSGTSVASGRAVATVTAVGNETKLGKIGKSIEQIEDEKTPLEIQIGNFVKKMAIAGALFFVIVWVINYLHTKLLLNSLLQSLTLAMSILPEEIPVAFTTFMALGAWRLMKMGIVVKQMKTVETLGSATVICTDKTGTLTENRMSLATLFLLATNHISPTLESLPEGEKALVATAMWASEPIPFDPMDVALHDSYPNLFPNDERPNFKLIHEYPLSGQPPMMTHIFEDGSGKRIIAAKGAPEALMAVSQVTDAEKQQINEAMATMANDGFRVLGVGLAENTDATFPEKQQDFHFKFVGLVGFYDPPKKNIQKVLEDFYAAGIAVKIITGDNVTTTTAIAKQIGCRGYENSITGDALMNLPNDQLAEKVLATTLFTRMFPEAKLKIINALKQSNQIVAMTGDGVNDGPALKAAHIGIAMGKKGTEIAKQAASLILLEDDLSKMVTAVEMGRKIYANLKKAIQYIISIHIPIILTVFIPLALGWRYPNIFSPVHIIFLEIIMGPTCSIMYENEPIEKNTMLLPPKPLTNTFFNWRELSASIVQGLVITVGTLFIYQYSLYKGYDEALTRTMTFTTLIAANIFLTLINRSFFYSIITTLGYKNNLVVYIISITTALVAAILFLKPVTTFFKFEHPNLLQLTICIVVGLVAVIWFELVKLVKRRSMAVSV